MFDASFLKLSDASVKKMKQIKITFLLVSVFISMSCSKNKEQEKFHSKRNKIQIIEDNIRDIDMKMLIGRSKLNIINDYLIVTDLQETKKGIHFFDKKDFTYLASTGQRGKGPGEIVDYYGVNIVDEKECLLYLCDYGRMVMWKFHADSVINNEGYMPQRFLDLNKKSFIGRAQMLNDSMLIGEIGRPINHHSSEMSIGTFNFNSNETRLFDYNNSKLNSIKRSKSILNYSSKHNTLVICYSDLDLMAILDKEGRLISYIYGPGWGKNKKKRNRYFSSRVHFIGNKIIVPYAGKERFIFDQHKRPKSVLATKFEVFDINGNYLKTLETNHEIAFFCVDEDNNRLIVYFEDRINPLAYIDLDGIID